MTIEILAGITGDKFYAGIVLWDDVVIEAAPIVGYMKKQRWTRAQVRQYCEKKGWQVEVITRNERRDVDSQGRSRDEVRRSKGDA